MSIIENSQTSADVSALATTNPNPTKLIIYDSATIK